MPLVMGLIRERGNVIDYEIPITGNLKDPQFHLSDVIFDLIKNIFVKPPTTPYRQKIKNLEGQIETALSVKWEMRQRVFRPEQVKFVRHLSTFLKETSNASIAAYPNSYVDKEKEYILFFETKKKYFLLTNHQEEKSFSPHDSLEVEKMSVKDPSLVKHISKHLSDTVMFTLQEKCINFIGNQIVNHRFHQLVEERDRVFLSFFKENGTEKRVMIHKNVNNIPYNHFSYFKLNYQGDIPASLRNAYRKMIELNDEEPRKKYMEYRKKEIVVISQRAGR